MRGLERAEAAGADAIAVFTATTDAFTTANIGMTVEASLAAFAPVLTRAAELGWWRRGYVSTAFGCPYTGRVEPSRAVDVALRLLDLGVDEVCFGDTIGVGVPGQVAALTGLAVEAGIPLERIAFHFHDTRGTALANVAAGLDAGRPLLRLVDRRDRRLPVRAGRGRQSRDRGPRLPPRRLGLGDRASRSRASSTQRASSPTRSVGRSRSKVGQAGGWDPTTGARDGALIRRLALPAESSPG